MNDPLKVTSDKPSLPTLWLDTSVVIKLTKIARGEALQSIEVERLTRLKKLINELGEAGKLLCPQADQEEEYADERLDSEVHRDFLSLSMGITLSHRQGIFDFQAMIGMKACVEKANTIHVPLDSYFHSDPVEELNAARSRRFVIGGNMFKDPEILARRRTAKSEVQRVWEELRQEFAGQHRTYEEQLQEERRRYADAVVTQINEFEQKVRHGGIDFWGFMGVQGFLLYRTYWNELGGKPPGTAGLHFFFCSPYFNELPIVKIRCQLGADLLTGNQPILSGDVMDVELLSTAIPVSHHVLTDRKMADRIHRRGIVSDWQTEVHSMSDIDKLFGKLESLR
jgi:hypothetical protein